MIIIYTNNFKGINNNKHDNCRKAYVCVCVCGYLQYFQLKIEIIIYKCTIKWSGNIYIAYLYSVHIIILLLATWGQEMIATGREHK